MCLMRLKEFTQTSGIAYKVVRRTEIEGEYKSLWPRMGTGLVHQGITKMGGYMGDDLIGTIPVNITYKIGKCHRVRHSRVTLTEAKEQYPAGIHLYRTLADATINWPGYGYAIIECRFSKAVACDYDTIVAMSITPKREVSLHEFTTH